MENSLNEIHQELFHDIMPYFYLQSHLMLGF